MTNPNSLIRKDEQMIEYDRQQLNSRDCAEQGSYCGRCDVCMAIGMKYPEFAAENFDNGDEWMDWLNDLQDDG